jgi:hypothetical protein
MEQFKSDSETDTALTATMYDGNSEPKAYAQAIRKHELQNW